MNNFVIDHIDPLGQGVYKSEDKIYFIPKTLPSETGEFKIISRKKGVHFCQMLSIKDKSQLRVTPECKHYAKCNGCHYLHTDYQSEINFKQQSFERMLTKFDINSKMTVITSDKRLHYRNRIQLHYDLKQNKLGLKVQGGKQILEVPSCLLFDTSMQESFDQLYLNWQRMLPKGSPAQGHVELYLKNEEILTNWNEPYAFSGFSQVNQAVNLKMLTYFQSELAQKYHTVLDLFGGSGNLSDKLNYNQRYVVDLYPDGPPSLDFSHINLFKESALDEFSSLSKLSLAELLIIDPPRSGFKDLPRWVEKFKPQTILYVSCHPATMIRDIYHLKNSYQISSSYLIDLFPASFHFEGALILSRH